MSLVEVRIPYGDEKLSVTIPSENLLGILRPKEKAGAKDPRAEIARALRSPIGSRRLSEMASPGDKVAIVIDDVTRPAPSHLMLPPILDGLEIAGVEYKDITVIVGCGTHRQASSDEILWLVGKDVAEKVKVVNHDCDAPDLVYMGKTSFGTEVYLNKIFVEADLKILTGDIELHYYAGYGGGRKSVLPAVAGRRTIEHNHSLLLDPRAIAGNLDANPVHLDMTEAARLAEVDFILNAVLNMKKEVVRAFAGDLEKAFLEGVSMVDDMCKVPVEHPADIVITSPGGSPLDISLFQSMKAIHHVIHVVREGGIIILVAECREGHGNDTFRYWMLKFKDLEEVKSEIKRKFVLGGHAAYFLLKELEKARIILVSSMDEREVAPFKLETAESVGSALQIAFSELGDKSKAYVVPYGSRTLPIIK